MHRRKFPVVLAFGMFWVLSLLNVFAETEFFRIEDVRPGMKGTGRTCFQGSSPEEFEVEILGVIYGMEPGANAVLARLEGDLLDNIGVFEGMSGSPVFIGEKLLGAIAFTYPFAKEAICGITPITQMVEAFEENSIQKIEFHIDFDNPEISDFRPMLPGRIFAGLHKVPPGNSAVVEREKGVPDGHTLIPIATPLSMGGLNAKTLEQFQPKFQAMGLSVLQGGGGTQSGNAPETDTELNAAALKPGSNIVIPLIRGDIDVSAGGTVTYVEGNKIYAFGHSLLELGFTALPVHTARTVVIFPSLQSSFKILEMGEPVGSILQDRGSGVYGVLGEVPDMLPLQVTLQNSRGVLRQFEYELVRDRLLTPVLVNLAVYNTIVSSERAQGVVTIDVQGEIRIENHEPVEVYNRFSSDSGVADAISLSAAVPVNYLMAFGYDNLNIESINLEVTASENDRAALLDSIRVNRMEAKAGDSLELEISYIKADGESFQNVYPLDIPSNVPPGPLNILVADGTTIMSMDDELTEDEVLVPRDLSHLIQLINNIRKNDRLYVRLYRDKPGAVVRGEGLPGLPPSILSILGAERRSGAVTPLDVTSFLEYELPPADYMPQGSKLLTIRIKP